MNGRAAAPSNGHPEGASVARAFMVPKGAEGAQTMRRAARSTARTTWGAAALIAGLTFATSLDAAVKNSKAPLVCTRGGDQTYQVTVTAPDRVAQGGSFTVRIDSFPSGKIEHTGLLHLRDMEAEYAIPAGSKYVDGSAKLVPNTGTANVAKTAKVFHEKGVVHLLLPAKIEAGGSYTPPSIEFQLSATTAPGNDLVLKFQRYSVTAHAVVVGDVKAVCEPKPASFPLFTTTVTKS